MPIPPGSFTQLPPNSTGPKLATGPTYSENSQTVQDEKVILGEQYLATYIANLVVTPASTATVDSHLIQIMAGASLRVRIRRIDMYQGAMATAVTNAGMTLVRLTTAGTGGTLFTPAPLDPADVAAGATVRSLPSSKGTEGTVIWSGFAYFMQTLAASSPLNQPTLTLDFDRPRSKPLIISAGVTNGIALKLLNATAGATVLIDVLFDEIAWA